ncbi:SurA N-terminal domain-containing protein [Patescibacteria group bacterium]|nr:SurA N-terminal domain-containing protein [Patescibacteria group bacterium]
MFRKKKGKRGVSIIPKLKDLKTSFSKKTSIITLGVLVVLAVLYLSKSLFIVALVNGRPITRWTLDRELERVGGKQILNTKIAEILVSQEARNQKITVSDEEINQETKKLDEQFQAQGQTLDSVLALQNQSKKEFLRQLKIQLLVEKILGKEIEVTEEEIADYFKENAALFEQGATLASEKENIRQTLFNNKLTEKIQSWLQELQTKAKILYFVEF